MKVWANKKLKCNGSIEILRFYPNSNRTSNNSAQLRTSPTVDDQVIPNSCSSGQKIGNRIDQYDANVKGFALSQFSDENGAQWFFAILPSTRAKRSYHIGWIQKKDLQFVDKTSVDR
ncbi:hypothetical protein [Leptospira alexanderi]|uniref:hypothetical protein n=1 Tax=Leptospira alexanderi TaxID=100053 RepID=UPI00028895CD|nr:hypothetical protein [Leptospira alexanderi]